MATYITLQDDRLDRICRYAYGTENQRHVEMVLEANLGLSEKGPLYPAGLEIFIPEIEVLPNIKPTITLWV